MVIENRYSGTINIIGKGFSIWHFGSVVIGADRIGDNFKISANTLIG